MLCMLCVGVGLVEIYNYLLLTVSHVVVVNADDTNVYVKVNGDWQSWLDEYSQLQRLFNVSFLNNVDSLTEGV